MSKLKDCCDFQEGYVNPSQKNRSYFGGPIKWLRSLDLNNGYVYNTSETLTESGFLSAGKSAYMFPKDTIAISKSGTIGELGVLKNAMCGNRAVIDIKVDPLKADLMYIFYLLRYKKKEIINKAVGSIQKNLYISALETISLCHENLREQKKIGDLLCALDLKIELNNKIISELESMAKTLYDYWFLQFDFPDEDGKPYKSSGGNMVYNKELKREIPEGWKVGSIKDFGEIIGGGTPPTSNADYYTASTEGIGWITPYDMANNNNKYIAHGERDITKNGLNNSSAVLMPKGTVLMTSRAPIGYIGIATKELATNQGFKSVVPKEEFGSEFVYQVLISMIPYLKSLGTGSTFAEISKTTMEKVVVVIPPVALVKKFNNKVMASSAMIQTREKENRDLVSFRDFLLPMLMNGQVTFRDNDEAK